MKRLFLLLAIILCAPNLSARWTDYTVSPVEACTRAQMAVAGDVITVTPGNVPGGCWVSERNGNALAPITLKAQTPGTVWFTGSTATRKDAFTLYRSSWWRLEGLGFRDAENAGIRVSISDHTTIVNCTSKDNMQQGLLAGSSSYGTVIGSYFLGSKNQHGAYVSTPGVRGWTFDACTFALNGGAGCQINSQGASTGPGVTTECKVINCSIIGNGQAGHAAAINCLGVTNSVFAGNTVNDNLAGGISFTTNGKDGGESVGNVVNSCVVTFATGRGRAPVQQIGGSLAVTNSRLWAGKTSVQAIEMRNGATVVQSGNVSLPPMPLVALPPDTAIPMP